MTDETAGGPGTDPGRPAAIAARGATKRFPGVLANDSVDFHVAEGEIHTLLGENGAGKSTLAAMLCGLYQPDDGLIFRKGKQVRLRSPRDGLAHGIGMVHQHFRLVDRFTVAENVVLGDPHQSRILNSGEINTRVGEIGEQFGLPVDPEALISELTVGQRQRVEIIKILYRGADVLLLDEPTAVLTPQEVDALFVTVRAMASEGKAIVFISHKLGEVMSVSDRVTVMRAGRVTGEVATKDTSQAALAELMVGHPVEVEKRRGSATGDGILVASDVHLTSGDQVLLEGVDLSVASGEVLGIAGVAGNGQRPLAESLAGMNSLDQGIIKLNGTQISGRGPKHARKVGISYVPADRLGKGLVPGLSLTDNMLLTRKRSFFVNRDAARQETEAAIEAFEIKTPGTESEARVLSGGNAQKVLLARELADTDREPSERAIIVASPTRGLDIGAAEFVRGLLHQARLDGSAIVVISEDLDELRSLSDRIAVLYRGRIALEGPADELDLAQIGLAMAGVDTEVDA